MNQPNINAYKKCLEIFMRGDFSPEDVCLRLAKKHPEVFVSLYDASIEQPPYVEGVIVLLERGEKVQAIKTLRNAVNEFTLKEAKDVIENVIFLRYRNCSPDSNPYHMMSFHELALMPTTAKQEQVISAFETYLS